MLRNSQRVRVSVGKIALQVFLDVVLCAVLRACFDNVERVGFPIRGFCHRQIVDAPDFEQVDEIVTFTNDADA